MSHSTSDSHLSSIARHLLEFEEADEADELTPRQRMRAHGLIVALLKELRSAAERRRFLRIPSPNLRASVVVGQGQVECDVLNVGSWGMTLRGGPEELKVGDRLSILSMRIDSESIPLELSCEVRWKGWDGQKSASSLLHGLEKLESSPERWEQYFMTVYRPRYLELLRQLAGE